MVQHVPHSLPVTAVPLWRRFAIYGVLAVFALWCVAGFRRDIAQIDLAPLAAGWMALVVAGVLSLSNYALRVLRWQLYLRRLGHRLPWGFVSLTFMSGFAFTLSPGKLGEMVRGRYYTSKGLRMSQVTAAFFVERLLDLLAMIVLAAAVLAELQAYASFLWLALALVGALLAVIGGLPWERVARRLDAAPRSGLFKLMQTGVHMFVNARQFLSPGILLLGLVLGLLAWGAEAIGLKVLADVIQPGQISLWGAMGAYSIAIIVGALSFLPGGLGSTETVMAALLVAHGYSNAQAILLTLVCRLLTLWLAVAIGWLCVWWLRERS